MGVSDCISIMKSERSDLRSAQRIIIKCGTSVVSHKNGVIALGRVAYIVEQVVALLLEDRKVLLVSSGAVSVGRQKLRTAQMHSQSLSTYVRGGIRSAISNDPFDYKLNTPPVHNSRACAAAGQSGLINLYEVMFGQYGVQCAQVLVTDEDFSSETRRVNLQNTLDQLMDLGIVPILNENDVISTRNTPLVDNQNRIFWDNDSLAGLLAVETRMDLLIILSDIDGLFQKDPSKYPNQAPIPTVVVNQRQDDSLSVEFGEKSRVGRGGMEAKLSAVRKAVSEGVRYVVIANGYLPHTILQVMQGNRVGTLFVSSNEHFLPSSVPEPIIVHENLPTVDPSVRELLDNCKYSSKLLGSSSPNVRILLLQSLLNTFEAQFDQILRANQNEMVSVKDKGNFQVSQQSQEQIRSRIRSLISRLSNEDPLHRIVLKKELSPGLELVKARAPIGVLFIAGLSLLEDMMQVISLGICSGNVLLIKKPSEFHQTSKLIESLVQKALEDGYKSAGAKSSSLVHFIDEDQVIPLLSVAETEKLVDLVILQGNEPLVGTIRQQTRLPILQQTKGVCHIFVHSQSKLDKAIGLIVESKVTDPLAPNAVECLLLERNLFIDGSFEKIYQALQQKQIDVFFGPRAQAFLKNQFQPAESLNKVYNGMQLTLEMVDDVCEAVELIHKQGSGHTDVILTEDPAVAEFFQTSVDSTCVFWNCSTKFSNGNLFGENDTIGFSTSRFNGRGPIGIDELITNKWKLSSSKSVHQLADVPTGVKHVARL